MQKEKKKGKNIVELINDKSKEKLMPCFSYGVFKFGKKIKTYLAILEKIGYEYHKSKIFHEYLLPSIGIELWVRYGVINSIYLDKHCFYKGYNLIKMEYSRFQELFHLVPDKEDVLPVYQPNGRFKHETVYDFDGLGLQIWIWRGRIVTVIAYKGDIPVNKDGTLTMEPTYCHEQKDEDS